MYIFREICPSVTTAISRDGEKADCCRPTSTATKILPQLFHPAYMAFPIPGTPRLIAPSFVGPYYAKEAPRPVTVEELQVIIRQFGEAALRVKKQALTEWKFTPLMHMDSLADSFPRSTTNGQMPMVEISMDA